MNVTFGRREAFRAIRHFRPERATKESDEIAVGAENERGHFTEAARSESSYRRYPSRSFEDVALSLVRLLADLPFAPMVEGGTARFQLTGILYQVSYTYAKRDLTRKETLHVP